METPNLWKSQKEAFQQSLEYMKGRMDGEIKSIKTPWTKFNDATTDGIEWHSTTVIGARPATGKTLIKDLIVSGAFKLNPMLNFRVLEFQFEMLGKNSAIREYSQHIEKSYKYLCSADGKLTNEDFEKHGRFGCPKCYDHFTEKMEQLVYPFHKGNVHTGKIPKSYLKKKCESK
jgi:replicative DNA helicase